MPEELTIIADPNSLRNCYQRYWHQKSQAVLIDGQICCLDCYYPDYKKNDPEPPVEEVPETPPLNTTQPSTIEP